MTKRRSLLALGVLGGAAGAVLRLRRRGGRERVDLHFEDRSLLTLDGRSPEAARLLALARRALLHARA